MENKDNYIRYIVKLKDDFYMPGTTIKSTFCGSIENITSTSIYFALNDSKALVIIPHNKIEWMAPSRELWKLGYTQSTIEKRRSGR